MGPPVIRGRALDVEKAALKSFDRGGQLPWVSTIPIHIAFLLILLLLVFGAKRLPEMGKSLGHGMRGFKDAIGGEPAQATSAPPAVRRPWSPWSARRSGAHRRPEHETAGSAGRGLAGAQSIAGPG